MREEVRPLVQAIERRMIGKQREIEWVLVALLARGHVLLEDVPGVGKTALIRALSASIAMESKRIQMTSDLLPSDILGVSIYQPASRQFEFKKGPLHHPLILADELNRASPKTQSALLESMAERQVTVDGATYPMPFPFFVMATQNPLEHEGTYRLPEAQLDRFLFRISLGYLEPADELLLLQRGTNECEIAPVVDEQQLRQWMEEVTHVFIAEELQQMIVQLAQWTRQSEHLSLGMSPRASLALQEAARAYAWIQGRDYVVVDDLIELFEPVIYHRLMRSPQAILDGVTLESLGQVWLTKVVEQEIAR